MTSKPKKAIKTIGIYVNTNKQNAYETAFRCVKYLVKQGITPLMLHNQYAEIGCFAGVKPCFKDQFYSASDCLVVLGGDGTLLGIARQASAYGTPICGINLGKLGFLTNGEANSYEAILQKLIDGDYTLDQRSMIISTVKKLNGEYESQVALNDLVVKATGIRMIRLTLEVDGMLLDDYSGDGVILATPTGSTAYSLAAGGPVVDPRADILLLNPICPHRLHDKSYVLPGSSSVDISLPGSTGEVIVSADGQVQMSLNYGEHLHIRKAPYMTNLILFHNRSFYAQLRRKFSDH
jgi:NAD+ kinase